MPSDSTTQPAPAGLAGGLKQCIHLPRQHVKIYGFLHKIGYLHQVYHSDDEQRVLLKQWINLYHDHARRRLSVSWICLDAVLEQVHQARREMTVLGGRYEIIRL